MDLVHSVLNHPAMYYFPVVCRLTLWHAVSQYRVVDIHSAVVWVCSHRAHVDHQPVQ